MVGTVPIDPHGTPAAETRYDSINSTSTGTVPNSAGVRYNAGIVGWHMLALQGGHYHYTTTTTGEMLASCLPTARIGLNMLKDSEKT